MNHRGVRLGGVLVVGVLVGAIVHAGEDKALQPGAVVPGPFQVLMVTGPRAGSFHAPVCEYDLNPAVLIFVRDGAEASPPLIDLLKKLDTAIAKHPQARLGACAVFLNDGGYRKAIEAPLEKDKKVTDLALTAATVAKEEKEAKVKALAKKENLNLVTLGLGTAGGPEKYQLNPMADITVLIFHQQKVLGNYAYPKGEFSAKDVDKILQQVESVADEVVKSAGRKR